MAFLAVSFHFLLCSCCYFTHVTLRWNRLRVQFVEIARIWFVHFVVQISSLCTNALILAVPLVYLAGLMFVTSCITAGVVRRKGT